MSFQILDIVIYGFNGERRILSLRPGQLNIITGDSKTGKTALIEIIDYCLGSETCRIYEGIIWKAVEWVGLRLQVEEGQAFVARRLPDKGKKTSFEIYYDLQREIELPEYDALRQTINPQTLKTLLSQHAGIGENIHQPPYGQTRDPLCANIRHALFFSFQQQSEVISNKLLFHTQSEQFIPQAIKDVLPYFLGAVDNDHVAKMTELRDLRRRLRSLERKLAEYESVRGHDASRAQMLLSEAQDIGLYDASIVPDSWEGCIKALQDVQARPSQPEEELARYGRAFERLQQERVILSEELRRIKYQLSDAKAFVSDRKGYSHEAGMQLQRLNSIELFERDQNNGDRTCPLCQSELSNLAIPAIFDLERSIQRLESQMRPVEERSPQMDLVIRKLEERMENVKLRLRQNREFLEAIQVSDEKQQAIRDYAARRAYFLGRIGLYLESLPHLEDTSDLKREIEEITHRISILQGELSEDVVQERLESIMSLLSRDMSTWAQVLGLEHSQYPLRLDIKQLTVVADTEEDGPIPMERMGSGENWVGYHLISHFALHKWFVNRERPVPRFLFIDQPSQVYFPADEKLDGTVEGIQNEDREAVARMYNLALKVAEELSPHFQIIMTDHADLSEDWFQQCVIERWRGGMKLVPEEWLQD
jgi:hypothetical protein